jgi:peptide/nickel transport system ATP-binding protein
MTAVPKIVEVKRLSVSSPTASLLRGVSFSIDAGERIGLIGESGSGKSLTSLAVFGLLPDNLTAGGSISFSEADHDIVGATDKQMARLRGLHMGMVFQEPMTALNPTMKIGNQVAEVLLQHRTVDGKKAAADRALELLAEVNLPDPARAFRSYPHELSGGQRQRVVLAIAMANKPSLLVCDEPTTALDVTVQAQMLALISTAAEQNNSALLFVTHDLAVVATICERVIVMFGGEVLESGSISQVFREPRHPYTRGLLAASDLDVTDDSGHLLTIPPGLFDYKNHLAECAYCTAPDRDPDDDLDRSRWIGSERDGYACWHEATLKGVLR